MCGIFFFSCFRGFVIFLVGWLFFGVVVLFGFGLGFFIDTRREDFKITHEC